MTTPTGMTETVTTGSDVTSYVYTADGGAAGAHALTSAPGASFSYDDAGRQTSRTISSVTTTLGWTETGMTETGMTETVTTGTDTTSDVYTADGQQKARKDPSGNLTLRVGDLWESDGTTTRRYLSFVGNPLERWLHTHFKGESKHTLDEMKSQRIRRGRLLGSLPDGGHTC